MYSLLYKVSPGHINMEVRIMSDTNSIYSISTKEEGGGILLLLEQQLDNFTEISSYISKSKIRPSTVFLPQSIKQLDSELEHNTDLILDCFDYLDIVNMYSFIIYGKYDVFVKEIVGSSVENRFTFLTKNIINTAALDDFLFSDKAVAIDFLLANKPLLAIYIYSLISTMLFRA